MNVTIENLRTGWFELKVGRSDAEIPVLNERLQELQQRRGRFRMRRVFSGNVGLETLRSTGAKPMHLSA
jgi:hypothetical protein